MSIQHPVQVTLRRPSPKQVAHLKEQLISLDDKLANPISPRRVFSKGIGADTRFSRRSVLIETGVALGGLLVVPSFLFAGPNSPEDIEFAPVNPVPGGGFEPAETQPGPGGFIGLGAGSGPTMGEIAQEIQDWSGVIMMIGAVVIGVGVGAIGIGGTTIGSVGGTGIGAIIGGAMVAGGVEWTIGGAMIFGVGLLGFTIGKGMQYLADDPPRKNYKQFPRPLKNPVSLFGRTVKPKLKVDFAALAMIQAYSDVHCTLASLEFWQGAKLAADKKWMEQHEKCFKYFLWRTKKSLPTVRAKTSDFLAELQKEVKAAKKSPQQLDQMYQNNNKKLSQREVDRVLTNLSNFVGKGCSEAWYIEHLKTSFLNHFSKISTTNKQPIQTFLSLDASLSKTQKLLGKL